MFRLNIKRIIFKKYIMNSLITCVALVLLSSILLFVYFKTRVGKVEEKLDIMFQLVQSHASQQNSMKIYENNVINEEVNNVINEDNELVNKEEVNLISVSEDESDESDESDSDSDDENINELVIGEDIKKISLNLENNDEDDDIPIILEKKGDIETLSEEDLNPETLSEEDLNPETLEEVSINNLSIEVDYEKYKVAELKQMCEDKELENYKKLKKSDLIDLLKNNL